MPGDLSNPAALAVAERNVQWNETFPEQGTNLARRRRQKEDRDQFNGLDQARKQEELQHLYETNKTAQDFYFREHQLDMERKKVESDLMERAWSMKRSAELLPLELELKRAQADADYTRERTARSMELRRANEERRELEHADALDAHVASIRQAGHLPGTPEYFRGVEEGLRKYPFAPSTMHTDLRAMSKVIPRPEDEPVTINRTTEIQDEPGLPPLKTERTVVSSKQSRAAYEAGTAPAASDFLSSIGLAKVAPTAAAKAPANGSPGPSRAPAPKASATPVDRTAIAKRALNDPNASEAHKAAARRILGVQ